MIAIVDYGMGNIHSVTKAVGLKGAQTRVTDKPEDILAADKVILPGVGAFSDAMRGLESKGLGQAILESIKKGKFFLGICLGMQLLFRQSEESKDARGLGVFSGTVRKFDKKGLKVPHIGWNQLHFKNCRLLEGIEQGSNVYFCHSYYVQPQAEDIIAAKTEYGITFASVINKDNIFAVQFHPEKSQKTGLKILENFVGL
ncbi:MAG: imidazole glycerol phosphate synthase subunit HisH [Candidatus Omnitrophica bacterium]|nr:imidazole glycerol phosphate synthase subunit HisH [Candidatus Omnitrophota bacterium]